MHHPFPHNSGKQTALHMSVYLLCRHEFTGKLHCLDIALRNHAARILQQLFLLRFILRICFCPAHIRHKNHLASFFCRKFFSFPDRVDRPSDRICTGALSQFKIKQNYCCLRILTFLENSFIANRRVHHRMRSSIRKLIVTKIQKHISMTRKYILQH